MFTSKQHLKNIIKSYFTSNKYHELIIKKYGNISNWNTSQITDMSELFKNINKILGF